MDNVNWSGIAAMAFVVAALVAGTLGLVLASTALTGYALVLGLSGITLAVLAAIDGL